MASGMRLAAAAPLDSHSIFPLHSFWISTSIISPRIMSSAAAANGVKVHTLDTFRPILKQLALSLAPPSPGARPAGAAINAAQVRELLEHLADASFTSNQQHHAMLGSALTALRLTGLDASAEVLAMASEVFLARSIDVSVPDLDVADKEQYAGSLDLVGTGGDGQDTFNVSTTAAIVAAGVPGIKVCKHGARASSSTSGSADLLISLSIPLPTLAPGLLKPALPSLPFAFLFASLYHPSLGPLAPIRRSLGFPTLFNVLGPLVNPARPRRCILGVHSPGLGATFAEALRKRGTERAWVVCGREGLDEISCEGETDVWELRDGEIKHFTVSPASFGLPSHPLAHVCSYSSAENAAIVLRMLSPAEETFVDEPLASPLPLSAEEAGGRELPPIPAGTRLRALADYTLLQSSALLYVAGRAATLPQCVELARTSMRQGGARAALEAFRVASNHAVQEEEKRLADDEERKKLREEQMTERAGDEFYYAPPGTKDAAVGTD